ncbi:unnamed protein product, partial [Effrenium voratum]
SPDVALAGRGPLHGPHELRVLRGVGRAGPWGRAGPPALDQRGNAGGLARGCAGGELRAADAGAAPPPSASVRARGGRAGGGGGAGAGPPGVGRAAGVAEARLAPPRQEEVDGLQEAADGRPEPSRQEVL